MNKAVLSPSKARQSSSERTLKLLHEKLDEAESEVKNLSDNLISYGFNSVAAPANNSERKNVIETIAPFEVGENIVGYNDTIKKNYEDVVSRVCHVESTVQSLKLALVSLEAENTLMTRNSATKTLHANESYEKTLMKLKKDLTKTQKSLGESERFRAQTEEDFQKLRKILNCDAMTNSDVVLKIQEMYVTQDEIAKNADDLCRALNKEKNLRKNLEDSQSDLLNRVTEMEKIVERENHEMKMLSGDCMKLKRELLETSSRYDEEYQTRIKLETYVDKLRNDTEEMESKLLAISNDKQTLQLNLMMLKHENKELKQKEEFTQQSNNTLKDANLELEKRFKEMIEIQRKLEDDNKILVAKHCDSVEQQKKAFAAKLQEQDKILDEAKESILQELRKEKQELLEKEKEIVILQKDRDTKQVLLDEKDKELSNIKEVLEKLTNDRENMIEENDKVLMEIKRDLDKFVSEKTCLSAELDDRKVENESLNHQNKILSDQCEMLKVRVDTLEQQQANHSRINIALQNMVEDKRRLAYENGVLSAENEKLQKKEKTAEKHLNELKNLLLTKDKEIESLMKQREENLKVAEKVIQESESYEKKHSKQIKTLHSALNQSKEDNKKLAETLNGVMTSHTHLQSLCEQLQTELGKRDSRLAHLEREKSNTEERIVNLNQEVETLKIRLVQNVNDKSEDVDKLHLLEQDREKLLGTIEPLMKTNKDLQESLEGMANELKLKNNEIKKLRASSVNVKREMEVEAVTMETKIDEVRKTYDAEIKEIQKHHKKEIGKMRKDFQEIVKLKNSLKEENVWFKSEKEEMDGRIKKLREKLKQTKHQLDDCIKREKDKEVELEVAHNKIESMNRELTTLENLKIEYNQNNIEQARSLQDFISQLTQLQEEFQILAQAQHETKLLCKQKDERIKKEKQRRRETELICEKLKSREKHLKVKHDVTERQLNEANFESHQVAVNLKEAHDWFKNKFTNLQSELKKSRRIQNVLQKDNIDHYKALHEERRRADEATERAKDIIKSSREMISKLVGQVTSTTTINHETNEIS